MEIEKEVFKRRGPIFCRYFTTGTDPWGHYDINFFYL